EQAHYDCEQAIRILTEMHSQYTAWISTVELGLVQFALGDRQGAIQVVQQWLDQPANRKKSSSGYVGSNLAIMLVLNRQFREAEHVFQQFRPLLEGRGLPNGTFAAQLGVLEMCVGQREEALRYFQKTVEINNMRLQMGDVTFEDTYSQGLALAGL